MRNTKALTGIVAVLIGSFIATWDKNVPLSDTEIEQIAGSIVTIIGVLVACKSPPAKIVGK